MNLTTEKHNKKNNFISPDQSITDYYDDLIKNNPDEFQKLYDTKRLKTTCLSPVQQKYVKKLMRKENKLAAKEAIKTLWLFLRNYKSSIFWLIFVTFISTVLVCLALFGLQQLTRLIPLVSLDMKSDALSAILGTNVVNNNYNINMNVLNIYGGILILFYLVSALLMWAQTKIMVSVSQRIGYKIRQQLFSKIQKLSVSYFDKNSSGDLMSKFTNDIDNITNALSQNVVVILNGIFSIVSMLLCMFLMSSTLALITIGLTPLMFLPMMFVIKRSQPLFKYTQISLGKLNGYIEEMISGQSVVNLYDQAEHVNKEFKKINDELLKYSRKAQAASAIMFPYANFFSYVLIMIITVIGIVFITKDIPFYGVNIADPFGAKYPNIPGMTSASFVSSIATIAAFSSMARGFLMPFAQIANVMNILQAALAGSNRAFGVFDEKDEITEIEHLILSIAANKTTAYSEYKKSEQQTKPTIDTNDKYSKLEDIHLDEKMAVSPKQEYQNVITNGAISVKHLNFSYVPEKQILFDINIEAKEGQKIAIVGPTGSGKSTFINLLTKFYDINDGVLNIGKDVPIQQITKESMRKNVSIVLQDTFLFNISIKDNIKCGNLDATDEEVINAAKIANAHNFIMQLENGYDTVLEDNGESLSQGQRQLLAIARAVLVKSSILILDEATSSIDSKTEVEIQSAMLRLMANKTSFIIAHRLSTIQNADQILVLKDGRIIERGTHEELLALKGFYFDLHNSQFYEEE